MLIGIVIAFLHQLSLLGVNSLPQVFKSVGHVLLCSLALLYDFSLPRLEPLILVVDLIDLALDLHLQLFNCLDNNRVGLLQQLDIVASMFAVDHALRAYRWHIAIKAEVGNFLFWMLSARFTHLPKRS